MHNNATGRALHILKMAKHQSRPFMKSVILLLVFVTSLFAQQPQPDHINQDVIGESVDQYITNNSSCRFFSNPRASRTHPGHSERRVLCVPVADVDALTDTDIDALTDLKPNYTYQSIALKTVEAIFLDEEGLVSLTFELKRSDYDSLAAELLKEFGLPEQVSEFEGKAIAWDNGRSRIDLQKGDCDDEFSYLFLSQDEYLWKSIIVGFPNGEFGDTEIATIDGDYLFLQDAYKAEIKLRIVNW